MKDKKNKEETRKTGLNSNIKANLKDKKRRIKKNRLKFEHWSNFEGEKKRKTGSNLNIKANFKEEKRKTKNDTFSQLNSLKRKKKVS